MLTPKTARSLALFLLIALAGCTSNEEKQPNIIIFLVDDMGVTDTSMGLGADSGQATHSEHANIDLFRTPNLERLAQNGVTFTNFYAHSVCSPSRVSLLTGQNSARHHTTTWIKPSENNAGAFGPNDWNWKGLNSNHPTLPALLKQAGYKTIHIGKGHFGPLGSVGADPTNLGFDTNIAGSAWGHPKSYLAIDHYGNHPKYSHSKRGMTHNIDDLSKYHDSDTFLTEALTQEANHQIALHAQSKAPFLLYLSHYGVHAPFQADPRFIKNYDDKQINKRAKAYASLVEGVDNSLGSVLAQLKRLDIADNTLIIFLGDNGSDAPLGGNDKIASAAPLRGKKGTSWEGGMRAPLVIAWGAPPESNAYQSIAVKPGHTSSQVTSIIDIYPTILNALALDSPIDHTLDGDSLSSILSGLDDKDRQQRFLNHFPHEHRHSYYTTLRVDDWKLVYNYFSNADDHKHKLFNLANDPSENVNLATKDTAQLNRMIRDLALTLDAYNAQYPIDKYGNPIKPTVVKP